MIKYDFQKASSIPILDSQGMTTVLKLKKRRFQCKVCRRVSVSETSLVQKNCQIPKAVWAKITQLHTEKLTNSAIAKRCHISVSAVQRKLAQFTFKENFSKLQLSKALSWDEFSRNKGNWPLSLKTLRCERLSLSLKTTIKNLFHKYPKKVRDQVKIVTMDISGSYILIIKQLRFFIFMLRLKQSTGLFHSQRIESSLTASISSCS